MVWRNITNMMFCSQLIQHCLSVCFWIIAKPILLYIFALLLSLWTDADSSMTSPSSTSYVPKSQRSSFLKTTQWILLQSIMLTHELLGLLVTFILHQLGSGQRRRLKKHQRRCLLTPPLRRRFRPTTKRRHCRRVTCHVNRRLFPPANASHFKVLTSQLQHDASSSPRCADFGVGSFRIRIDNHCSFCVSNRRKHFVGDLVPMNATIQGISGSIKVKYKGTVCWTLTNDMGQVTTHDIPNTLFLPSATECILSPQHWSQALSKSNNDSAHALTNAKAIQLTWGNGIHTKTVPLDPLTNVATMDSASDYASAISAYTASIQDNTFSIANSASPSTDSVSDVSHPSVEVLSSPIITRPRPITFYSHKHEPLHDIHVEDTSSSQSSFLNWHYRLNHMPYSRMRLMIERGLLPKHLKDVRPPACSACMIGKATRRPWRTKGAYSPQRTPNVKAPGDCISVDQLQSTTPGLIAQIRGFITKRRYHFATVFVDQWSGLSFLHLQETSKMSETLVSKEAFESFARNHGVIVHHYHADNGRFAEKGWMDHVAQCGQTISFCGVNAHHQNGVAEKRIRDLQETSRAALIHAKSRWPDAIETYLWPYALRSVNNAFNVSNSLKTRNTPLSMFSQLENDSQL